MIMKKERQRKEKTVCTRVNVYNTVVIMKCVKKNYLNKFLV